MQPETLQKETFAFLGARGFDPARWLPVPDLERKVRPPFEIASRLMALNAVFTWASAPEDAVPSESLHQYIDRNSLRDHMSAEEAEIFSLPRDEAQEAHADAIGWKLENMWPLAWALGFEAEPTIEASQIDDSTSRAIVFDFLGGLEVAVEELARKSQLRSAEEVIALEYRFYCAHNAVRSAQLGEDTVPEDFDPMLHGGAIHERRHALTWCLSPGVAWNETDLST